MADLKSTTIVPIACYCFFLGGYFLYLVLYEILANPAILSSSDLNLWLPVVAFFVLASYFIAIGIGFLLMNRMCWKILFFSLAVCITGVAALILVLLVSFILDSNLIYSFIQTSQFTPEMWFTFLFVFLSGIIVLYYLTHEEVVNSFGGMDEMVSPF